MFTATPGFLATPAGPVYGLMYRSTHTALPAPAVSIRAVPPLRVPPPVHSLYDRLKL